VAKERNMKRARIAIVLAIVVGGFFGIGTTMPETGFARQGTSLCVPSTDKLAIDYRRGWAAVVSAPDTASARQRASLGLSLMSAGQVAIVTDSASCRIASEAYDTELGDSYPVVPVIVLQLGSTRNVVIKNSDWESRWMNMIFNSDFSSVLHRGWY
jgi:hypothetical protein